MERTRNLVDRASQVHDRYGVGGVLREGFDKVVLRSAALDIVHVLVLRAPQLEPHPVDSSFELGFLTPQDVARFSTDPASGLGPEFVARARAGLDLCYAAIHGDRLANYGWYAVGSVEPQHAAGVALGLPADTAYMYKGFTHPDFRGQRLHGACMCRAFEALRARGIERLISFVYWSNEASLRSYQRLGYRSLGLLVVGPRGLIRVPVAARRLGVTFGSAADGALAARSAAGPVEPLSA